MSVLWCGGEDIDFPNGSAILVSTAAAYYRSGWARCGISPLSGTTYMKSNLFPGGAVTSCWLSFRAYMSTLVANGRYVGLGLGGTNKWLCLGSASSSGKLALIAFDATTPSELATESGTSLVNAQVNRFDIQLSNYGGSSTVNVYMNGVLLINYSGSTSITGVGGFDSVFSYQNSGGAVWVINEVIVATDDTRLWPGLVTLAITGVGTTDDWTGTITNINGTTISDLNPVYTNTNTKDEEANVTDPPGAVYAVQAIKISARAAKSVSSTPTKIALGYKNGANVAVGSDIALTGSYVNYEQIDSVDPTTGLAWVTGDIAGLQIDVRSKA